MSSSSTSGVSATVRRSQGLTPATAALVRDATARLARGDLDGAERIMMGVLALAPAHTETLRLAGLIDHRRGRLDDADAKYRRAFETRLDDAWLLAQSGELEMDRGNGDAGLDLLRRACGLAPGEADLWFRLGIQLDRGGHHQQALDAALRALTLEPAHPVARMLTARNRQALGRIDEAAADYRRVIAEAGPRAWQAWFALVDLKTTRLDAKETQALEKLSRSTNLSTDARATLDFALGKVYEDAARHADALRAFQRANVTRRASLRWSAAAFTREMEDIRTAFAALPPVQAASTPQQGNDVIFVVGMPRSGTTLVEQILAAHPAVEGASELPDLPAVIANESRRRNKPFVSWVGDANDDDWRRLGLDYLERTARWRRVRPRFTDKLPDNWTRIEPIRRMLPSAVIVDCRRDALETCWSCYKQLFAPTRADYSYDIDELADYFRTYRRCADDAAQKYPSAVRTLVYETLLADPENQIRSLLDFCGLPFDPACLQSHTARRAVRTPSSAQVRLPMATGTARASLYGPLLDDLRSRLR